MGYDTPPLAVLPLLRHLRHQSAAAIFGAAYFLPTIIACTRDVKGKFWIFILNLFFGFSGLGYALAFFYACGPSRRDLWLAAERERLSLLLI